jgi:hypothetical protein
MATDITRIYLVQQIDTGAAHSRERLVRAGHKFAAHRHVSSTTYRTRLATQDDLERLLKHGVQVEQAGEDGATASLFE